MYSGRHDPERWVVGEVLDHQARTRPDAVFVEMVDGGSLTFSQAADDAARVAAFLAGIGVEPGDRVAVFLPNSLDIVRVWLGLGRLGAVFVVLNTELKGGFLAHQLKNAGARVAVTSPALLPALTGIASEIDALTVVVADAPDDGGTHDVPPGWRSCRFDEWRDAADYRGSGPRACDVASIMYTSGTSGPSKGVLMPHAHCFLFGLGTIDNLRLDSRDTYYVVLPLFHANGLFIQVYACLIAGAKAVVRRRFSPSAWLQDVRRHGATITNTLGILSSFVFEQPAQPDDRDHRLRLLMAAPNIPEHEAIWRTRFGIGCVLSGFGMTEANIPAWGTPEDTKPGTAGRVYARHFEVEIRDPDTDVPKKAGEVGEIMVRPRTASGFMAGYHAMPEKTVEAWRNLWFHTGDAGIIDEEGYLTFVDRIRDCIRRRGQNISSYEVEAAVMRVPGVAEVAAYAVPASRKGGEDEVMLAVVLEQGSGLTCADLAAHADADLPRFARPRFVEIVDALPKTPTGKVRKVELRNRPIAAGAWDREAPVGAREIELAG